MRSVIAALLALLARRDGTLTAIDVRIELDGGAYRAGGEDSDVIGTYLSLYRCAAVRAEQVLRRTHLGPAVAFRAPGFAEGASALERFMTQPSEGHRVETALAPGELVLGVRLPPHPPRTRNTYLKAMERAAFSFALAGVAAVVRLSHGKAAHARVVLSGVGAIPGRSPQAEAVLVGRPAGEERFDAAARAALQAASPLRHNGYKVPLARALLKRALRNLQAEKAAG